MRHLLDAITDEVPPTHKTTLQWSQEWGISESQTRCTLRRLVRAGIAGISSYRVPNGGCIRPVPHYYELTHDSPGPQETGRQGVTTHRKGHPAGRKGPPVHRRNT